MGLSPFGVALHKHSNLVALAGFCTIFLVFMKLCRQLLLFSLLPCVLTFSGCEKKGGSAENVGAANVPDKLIATAEVRDLDYSIEVTGDVAADFQLDVKAEVGGKIRALHVDAGQLVAEGDPLVEIDDKDLQAERASVTTEIDGARISVDKLRRNYERSKSLFESKLVSREVFDNLLSDYQSSQNNLDRSQRRLDTVDEKLRKTRVNAPIKGTVLWVNIIPGQVVIPAASVNNGTTILTIADLSKLIVNTHVNQYDVAKLKMGQKVTISTESLRGADMAAEITFIAPVATMKNNIKGFAVEAKIVKVDPRLRPGMTVALTVPVASASHAVSVPISAVFRGPSDERIVYLKNGDSAEQRNVEVGVTNLDFAEIKSGIVAGDRVLLVEPKPPKQS